MTSLTKPELTFTPSPWPFIVSVLVFPLILPLVIAFFVSPSIAIASFAVCLFLFFNSFLAGGPILGLRFLNALGALNQVKISSEGIVHNGWCYFPFSYRYHRNDIHSLRLHYVSPTLTMIAFTPVNPEVGKFYRSRIDGAYGLPVFGNSREILDAMVEFHRRYATHGLPSVADEEWVQPR